MGWALSRTVYHALAAATTDAREHGYPEVTGAHLIAAFLDEPGSVVRRACPSEILGATIKTALADTSPMADAALPVGFGADVRYAVLDAEADRETSSNTGHVCLRLLTDPDHQALDQLDSIGVDATGLLTTITTFVGRGEEDLADDSD
jgi:ATP-dependent Clp protease ATP-binding subunit ClpA